MRAGAPRTLENPQTMDAEQCRMRAAECAANAVISADESVSLEFLRLAAQWRAMAVRNIFLGAVAELDDAPADVTPEVAEFRQFQVCDPNSE